MKIFLIGFMGIGKTFWGRKWSQKSNLSFYDLDELIETAEKKSITSIFENEGEDFFRNKETIALRTFSQKENCIIACGGGAPCFADNMQWMNKNGTTVYLSASPNYIYNRLINEKEKRPLIKNLSHAALVLFIEQKLKERELFYNQASIILPVEEMTDDFVPDFIIKHLQNT